MGISDFQCVGSLTRFLVDFGIELVVISEGSVKEMVGIFFDNENMLGDWNC